MKPQLIYCPNCGRHIPGADIEWGEPIVNRSDYATIDCPNCGIRIDMEHKPDIECQGSLLVVFQ